MAKHNRTAFHPDDVLVIGRHAATRGAHIRHSHRPPAPGGLRNRHVLPPPPKAGSSEAKTAYAQGGIARVWSAMTPSSRTSRTAARRRRSCDSDSTAVETIPRRSYPRPETISEPIRLGTASAQGRTQRDRRTESSSIAARKAA